MIYTSSYKEGEKLKFKTVSISGNSGKGASYEGECFPGLAPKLSFFRIWHSNIGKVSIEENNKYYIEEYYREVLSKLDSREIYEKLDNCVLLCYEEGNQFCHRHIVSAWLELTLGIEVFEIKCQNQKVKMIERPSYIKKYLEELMLSKEKAKVLKI